MNGNTQTQNGDSSRQSNGQFAPGHRWRFTPGRSGNPAGRPRGESFAKRCARICAEPAAAFPWSVRKARALGLDPETMTIGELLANAALHHAMRGNAAYFREVLNRMEGKSPDRVLCDDEEPLQFELLCEQPPPGWHTTVRQLIGYEAGDPPLPGETASCEAMESADADIRAHPAQLAPSRPAVAE